MDLHNQLIHENTKLFCNSKFRLMMIIMDFGVILLNTDHPLWKQSGI